MSTKQTEALAEQLVQQEIEELTTQRDKLADILTRTANALKGQPAELSAHSWHDLPEVAQQLKAAQQQEPVGEVEQIEIDDDGQASAWFKLHDYVKLGQMLYTSPQSKPWVGLTPAEVHDIWCYNHTPQEVCDAVSAKLREKNA